MRIVSLLTENGLTVAEELEILESENNDKINGPFRNTKTLVAVIKASPLSPDWPL